MNRLDELSTNGRAAREAGRVDEAAIFYEEAYKLAKELKALDAAINFGTNAVHNLVYLGNNIRALSILIDILQLSENQIDEENYMWLKIRYCHVQFDVNPNLDKLLFLLGEIEDFSKRNDSLLLSSVFLDYAFVFYYTGQYEKSLEFLERGWSLYTNHDYVKYSFCSRGMNLNLTLGDLRAAERWLSLYKEDDTKIYSKVISELCDNILLHLYKETIHTPTFILISRLDDAISGFKQVADLCFAKSLIVRVNLLKSSLGDPGHYLHPARKILLEKEFAKQNRYSLFEQDRKNILLIDYRLACLRFILNIKPVDDHWYQFRQNIPEYKNIINVEEVRIRAKKVRAAIKYAKILAYELDTRLQCNIYSKTIKKREDRFNEILGSLN